MLNETDCEIQRAQLRCFLCLFLFDCDLRPYKKQWNLENLSLKERESVTGQCQLLKTECNKGKTLLTDHIQSGCFVSTGAAVIRGLQTGEEAQIHHTRPSDQPAAT